jgi:predicted ATP-binding protein involved in virulence
MEQFETNKDEDKIERLKKQIDFIGKLKYTMPTNNIEYYTEGSRNRELEYFAFNFKPQTSKHFISDFVNLFSNSSVFEIKWLGISSGHKAYLNLFASIQHELKKVRQSNLLLCIDEGDLYLHPKWQIEFFDKLLTVLPIIFSGRVQLVLTSHSPFLLSDLPKQCVTILDSEFDGSTLNGVDLKINTFGGNLYDLYSEPFFLGNKRTSDFAYNKIKTLIDKVEAKEFSRQDKRELQKISNILGDEIIKFRIKKLLTND